MDCTSSIKIDLIVKVDEGKSLPTPANFANRQRARDRHRFPKVTAATADILTMLGVGRDAAINGGSRVDCQAAGTRLSILSS